MNCYKSSDLLGLLNSLGVVDLLPLVDIFISLQDYPLNLFSGFTIDHLFSQPERNPVLCFLLGNELHTSERYDVGGVESREHQGDTLGHLLATYFIGFAFLKAEYMDDRKWVPLPFRVLPDGLIPKVPEAAEDIQELNRVHR